MKIEQKIIERIKEIENATFDEDCIKLLLIEIREKIKSETILQEICHFVAHSDRNKGICHKKVDVRYAKFKLVHDNTHAILTEEFFQANKDKPERFFTDAMLSYIQTDKIEKNIFELIILSGIDDIESELFQKYYGISRKQVRRLVEKNYKLEKGYYYINKTISNRDYRFFDDILKFIRGTVTGKPAFSQTEIMIDFMKGLDRLGRELNYSIDFSKIKAQTNDIIVSILSLLDESTFKLFDGNIGTGFLSLHPEKDGQVICLMSETGKFTLPLITTQIRVLNYIESTTKDLQQYEFGRLPWNSCRRNNIGKLVLVNSTMI